jgi:RNA polymerase sigma factor (sigma-70 family)
MSTSALTATSTDEQLASVMRRPRDSAAALTAAQGACRDLYRRHAGPLLAFLAARAPRADLEDVHHAIWLRVWEQMPGHFDGAHFRAWLYSVARNYLIDQSRRRRPETTDQEGEWADPRPGGPEEKVMEEERRQALERCLQRLAAELADLVRGRLKGEDYPELCRRLGLTPTRAHKLFHAAKTQLQECVNRATP